MEGIFYSKTGQAFRGRSYEENTAIWRSLQSEYGLSALQLCEAASYSFAMVIRYALGLSATGGKMCALVNDTRAGWITLATVRHLMNAGADLQVIFLMDPEKHGPEIAQLITPLTRMGVQMDHWTIYSDAMQITELVEGCHNILCGLFNGSAELDEITQSYVRVLNECQTPVHAVDAPLGVNVDSGKSGDSPLYASSTLSLGAPFIGLADADAYLGRHYLCDISATKELYTNNGGEDLGWFFAEQPVSQIVSIDPSVKKGTT